MYRKILIAYDGSEPGRKAFNMALDLAVRDKADLYVLSVVRTLDVADDVETEAVIENSRAYHTEQFALLKHLISEKGIKGHFEVTVGHPAEQIIYSADRHDVDLIVIGHRGRSKFARLLLGSVSKNVVQYADRPVMVVR
ncbi:MAG TPA: universal stress protein [Gammaproteobacteria bacterium]|nr:universal stress protein [Gammaproteobacteria bacterium]